MTQRPICMQMQTRLLLLYSESRHRLHAHTHVAPGPAASALPFHSGQPPGGGMLVVARALQDGSGGDPAPGAAPSRVWSVPVAPGRGGAGLRQRLHAALAYSVLAMAAGLCAVVFATDGEILAMLSERRHAGRAKGKIRISVEKRAAEAAAKAAAAVAVAPRRRWPGGLPWLDRR